MTMGPAHSIDKTYPSHEEWPFILELLCASTQCDISDVKASLHKRFHRITERFGLEGISKFIYFQHPMAMGASQSRVLCEMPSKVPGDVCTPAHIGLGMALEEMTNAKKRRDQWRDLHTTRSGGW
ncbi:hypothetical protein DUI87_08396 [Hirundo rustica rustica]|uniref:Uncharacterized protein n=1 Tax=Hirundo rustica rustica TaxID=333673 RepID=A0A3M0KSA6_HIRRU|nr:hypothetical protein DUI87_08396 [Hirundo rustica rustica]